MTNKKATKGALLTSAISMLLCVSMLLGTTFAWFTDSVVSENNIIKAGNLDVEVEYTLDGNTWKPFDGAKDLFQKGLWEPGHTEVVALKIKNNGSLALKYNANMNIVSETPGTNKDGKDIVLSDILTVSTLSNGVNQFGDAAVMLAFTGENAGGLKYQNTSSFKTANILANDQELMAGDAIYLIVKVDMAETVGNEANAKDKDSVPSITFGINVLATQFTYENDSFGNQYDKEAAGEGLSYDDTTGTYIADSMAGLSTVANLATTDATITSVKYINEAGDTVDVPVVRESADITSAINAGSNVVVMAKGEYSMPSLANKEGFTIIGANGATIGGDNTATGFGSNFGKNTTIKNVTFSGTSNGVRYSYAKGGTTTFEDCTFAGDSTYGFHIDQSNGATFIFNNCTFSGFNAFASDLTKVVFNNCTFLHNGSYGHTNIWSIGEFNNCTWGEGTSVGPRGSGKIFFDGAEQASEVIEF